MSNQAAEPRNFPRSENTAAVPWGAATSPKGTVEMVLAVRRTRRGPRGRPPAAVATARAAGHAAAVAHMAAHARGAPAYAAMAVGLASPDHPGAAADEIRWAFGHASTAVRECPREAPRPGWLTVCP